jgi:hypothetical protein
VQTLQGTKENRSSYKCKKDNSHNRDATSINIFFRSKFNLFSEVWNSCCIFNSQLHVPSKLGRITVVHPNLQLCRTLHFLRLILKGNILSKTGVLQDSCDENTVISFLLKTLSLPECRSPSLKPHICLVQFLVQFFA